MDITTRKRKNSDNCEMNVSKIRKNQERVTKYRKSLFDEKKTAIDQKMRDKYAERKRNMTEEELCALPPDVRGELSGIRFQGEGHKWLL